MLPSVSVLSRFSCRYGASAFSVRPSSRAIGGFVAAAGFRRLAAAADFARLWASRLPAGCRGCVVRRAEGFFWVSVPVLPASVPRFCRPGRELAILGFAPPACRSEVAAGRVWSC